MEQEQRQQFKKTLAIIIRRKEFIAVCLLISIVAGLVYYITTPKTYQASALIRYQQQSINPSKMSPDVKTRLQDMVSTVTKQVTSRTSLEKLIKNSNLYSGLRKNYPMEDIVNKMRDKDIKITNEGGDVFRVAYKGNDPKQIMRTANSLAAMFIEENQRFREERASQTSAYVKDELQMSKQVLDSKEAIMRDYKLKYYNEMPGQQQINITMLNNLQNQRQGVQENIQDLQRTKILIREQINLHQEILNQERTRLAQMDGMPSFIAGMTSSPSQPLPTDMKELDIARKELTMLLNRYTPAHPNVKRMQRTILNLEQNADQSPNISQNNDPITTSVAMPSKLIKQPIDRQFEQLTLQLDDIAYSISKLKKEQQKIDSKVSTYQKWVEAAPIREAEWATLTRDYNQLNTNYQNLLGRNMEAESAQNLERRQKGSQFKIVDTAHFPEKPCAPDFFKIMAIALALGLGVGGGISFGLNLLDNSVQDMTDLQKYQLPIICSIPPILSKSEQLRQRTSSILWGGGLGLSTLTIALAVVYLYDKGLILI